MKKCVYLSIIFLVAVLYAACTGRTAKQDVTTENGSADSAITKEGFARIDTAARFPIDTFNTESPALSLQLSLDTVIASNNSNATQINNTIIYAAFGHDGASVVDAIDEFIETAKEEYYTMRADYINEKKMEHSAAWLNYSYSIKGTVHDIHNDITNYIIVNDTYTGGAHGLSTHTLLNIDSRTGREITLNDIFTENFETTLTERLTERLAKDAGATSIDELKEWGYTALSDMYPTENFMLGKDSIIFLYNPYEIAPYSLGHIKVALGYDEIKDISKKY